MTKLTIALCIVLLWTDATIAQPSSLDDVYTTRAVVGQMKETDLSALSSALKTFSSKYLGTPGS